MTTPTSPEPVAWRGRGKNREVGGHNRLTWLYADDRTDVEKWSIVEPLYAAAPAPPVPEVELETTPEGRRDVASYLNQHLPRGFQFEDRIRAIADAMFRDISRLQATIAVKERTNDTLRSLIVDVAAALGTDETGLALVGVARRLQAALAGARGAALEEALAAVPPPPVPEGK